MEGWKRNRFWKRFREKIKVSKKIYGQKDRRSNKSFKSGENDV